MVVRLNRIPGYCLFKHALQSCSHLQPVSFDAKIIFGESQGLNCKIACQLRSSAYCNPSSIEYRQPYFGRRLEVTGMEAEHTRSMKLGEDNEAFQGW